MNTEKVYSICVVGGGAAGVMSALRAVLNNDECLLFTGNKRDRKKSREFWVRKVENIPGFFDYKKGVIDPHRQCLEWIQQSDFRENLILKEKSSVSKIRKLESDLFEITDDKKGVYFSRFVILCTGVMDIQPEIGGRIDPIFPYANKQVVDYCLRCDGHKTLGKKTVIIGHEPSAAWVAVMLHERYSPPLMIVLTHGEKRLYSDELKELILRYNIVVKTEKIVKVLGDKKSLDGYQLESGEIIRAEFSFISLGMIVYNELAKELDAEVDKRGFVIADRDGQTSVPGLFVAGDLRAGIKKQVYTAWDSAVDSADKINGMLRQLRRKKN